MSNIKKAFEQGKAFVAFITCGDPDLETTAAAVRAAVANGADLIELGIPFSDPTAEGPVIQGANIRALSGGVTTDKIFDLVRDLRTDITVPMVFMTYANVVFSYGAETFIATCKEIGIDGLILPDIPYVKGDEVAVMVNGLGATPLDEQYIVTRHIDKRLKEEGIKVHRYYVGEFATAMEMAGFSISLFKLDDELKELLDAPAATPFFKQL